MLSDERLRELADHRHYCDWNPRCLKERDEMAAELLALRQQHRRLREAAGSAVMAIDYRGSEAITPSEVYHIYCMLSAALEVKDEAIPDPDADPAACNCCAITEERLFGCHTAAGGPGA